MFFFFEGRPARIGDIAYRPLQDGDIILINRPPSVHQHSLIALSAKILPIHSVVSINPLCCTPFAGDFDGDCLHGYIPQSIRSRVELEELQLQMLCLSVSTPAPAVIKSMNFQGSLWTGKQLFSMLLPSGMNFSCDTELHIMDSEYGCKALDFLSSAQEVLCEFLTMRGLSVSLSDLYMFSDHYSRRKLAEGVKLALYEAEEAFRVKKILLDPINIPVLKCHDETEDVTYRQSDCIQSNPSVIRSSIMAFKDVFRDLLKMNSSQLSCISWNGQKSLNYEAESTSERVGGQNLYAVIKNSFIEGLNPLECLLHAISGRANFFSENADVPGTLTRKLMYHLRDIHVAYDGTVRSSYGQQIVQFSYDSVDDLVDNYSAPQLDVGLLVPFQKLHMELWNTRSMV
ncbi:DNA-directed RNA polymerase IV subunit 1 [Zea mays]|uniref:DNA-directed RNA polymerase n=1 Tax=Zea mays TaxID=4577 RepID=A0A3L6G9A7_MAIZE|nr:DNA-directed RNA polymerase IV subunit 1 [Zea mays]